MGNLLHSLLLALAGVLIICACGTTAPAPVEVATATEATAAIPTEAATATEAAPTELPSVPTSTAAPTLPASSAGNVDVLFVHAVQAQDGTWTFRVTLEHPDTGWEDYADGWDVVTPDGTVLKPDPDSPFTRLLLHPHVDEQPFTRSQSGITIPGGVTQVRVRGHDLVDGYGGRQVLVDLTVASGPDFEVEGYEHE